MKNLQKELTVTKQWKFVSIICKENSIAVELHLTTIISYAKETIVLMYSLRIVNGPLRQLWQFHSDLMDKAKNLNSVYYSLRCLRSMEKFWHKLLLHLSDKNFNAMRRNMARRMKVILYRNIYSNSATIHTTELKKYSISWFFCHNWGFTRILRKPDRVMSSYYCWHFDV